MTSAILAIVMFWALLLTVVYAVAGLLTVVYAVDGSPSQRAGLAGAWVLWVAVAFVVARVAW